MDAKQGPLVFWPITPRPWWSKGSLAMGFWGSMRASPRCPTTHGCVMAGFVGAFPCGDQVATDEQTAAFAHTRSLPHQPSSSSVRARQRGSSDCRRGTTAHGNEYSITVAQPGRLCLELTSPLPIEKAENILSTSSLGVPPPECGLPLRDPLGGGKSSSSRAKNSL